MRAEELEESRKKFDQERNQVEAIRRKLMVTYLRNAQAKKNLLDERKSLSNDMESTRKKAVTLKALEGRLKKQQSQQNKLQTQLQLEQARNAKVQEKLKKEKLKLQTALKEAKAKAEASKKALQEAELAKKAAELAKQNAIEQKVFFEEKTNRLEAINAVVLAKGKQKGK